LFTLSKTLISCYWQPYLLSWLLHGGLEVGKASTVAFVWTSVSIILFNILTQLLLIMIEIKDIKKSFETKILKGISTVFETGKRI
jgi:hypothetical protein